MKITKRDIKFFILGLLSFFIIETALSWNNVKKEIKQGYTDGYNAASK